MKTMYRDELLPYLVQINDTHRPYARPLTHVIMSAGYGKKVHMFYADDPSSASTNPVAKCQFEDDVAGVASMFSNTSNSRTVHADIDAGGMVSMQDSDYAHLVDDDSDVDIVISVETMVSFLDFVKLMDIVAASGIDDDSFIVNLEF